MNKINWSALIIAIIIDFGGSYIFQTAIGYISQEKIVLVITGSILSICAGYYIAKRTKANFQQNALLLGICNYILGCIIIYFGPGYSATDYFLLLLTPVLNLLGAYIGDKTNRK